MARPMFSYYGAKWNGARHYGAPRRDVVIEPFAGSACYSLRWNVEEARLYDVSQPICELWDFLIKCSNRDIEDIPDTFGDFSEIAELPNGPNLLVRFWIAKARTEPACALSTWYAQHKLSKQCRVWGAAVKKRIIEQKQLIRGWSIDCLSYQSIPDIEAHWHIDPPYNNKAGDKYTNSKIDYNQLAEWCKTRQGAVDVCEQAGATWLPFSPLYEGVGVKSRIEPGYRSKEAVWRRV